MPRVLVIAGTSFIGRYVCRRLRDAGHDVTATSRKPADSSVIACELTDASSVDAAVRSVQPDWIVQCAAATASREPRELYRTHIDGTWNVLESAHRHVPDAGLCLFGSAAECGPVPEQDLPVSEKQPCCPVTFFGASKLAQTHLAQAAAASQNQLLVIVRPFNVIGAGLPGFYFASAVARRLKQMSDQKVPPGTHFDIVNADSTRDFIDVRDVASAVEAVLRALMDRHNPPGSIDSGSVFHVATGVETPLLEAARLLGELAGGYVPRPAGDAESRGGILRSVGCSRKLQQLTGWRPEWTWQQSLRDLWKDVTQSP